METDTSTSNAPTAEGTFAKTPLPHVLLHAHNEQLSGSFELTTPSGPAGTFLVLDGQPAKARTLVDHYLLPVLAQIGVLTENQVTNLLPRLLASEELHGRSLIRRKLITEEQLELGLRAQLVRQMKTIVGLPADTQWSYYDGVDLLAGWGLDSEVRLDPFPFVWASLREQPPWDQVRAALTRTKESAVRLKRDADTARFAFEKQERAIVDMLRRKAWLLPTLITTSEAPPETVELVAYCMMLVKQVDFVAASEAALPSIAPPIDVPPVLVDLPPSAPDLEEVAVDSWLVTGDEPSSDERQASLPPEVEPRETVVPEETIAVAGPKRPLPPKPPRPPSEHPPVMSEARPSGRPTPIVDEPVSTPLRATPTVAEPVQAPSEPPPSSDASPLSRRVTPPVMEAVRPRERVPTQRPSGEQSAVAPPAESFASTLVSNTTAAAVDPAEFHRVTKAPPPDFEEPGYDVLPSPDAKPYANPNAEVFTRSTVQRMTAVTAEEVAAYIASQEAARAQGAPAAPAAPKAPTLARPPTPGMFNPLPRPPTPPPFSPVPHTPKAPEVAPPGRSLPRPPTPAMFSPVGPPPSEARPAVMPPEPPTVPSRLSPLKPLGPQAPTALKVKSDEVAPPSQGKALADYEALSSRKTMEISLDQALLQSMIAPDSSRPTVEVTPASPAVRPPEPAAPAPAWRAAPAAPKAPVKLAPLPPVKVAPPPPTHPSLELELDSPWDDGWDDVPEPFSGEPLPPTSPGGEPPPKK